MLNPNPNGDNLSPSRESEKSNDSNSINGHQTPIQLILSLISDAKPSGNGWIACCPAHDDHKPSLSITEGPDGQALIYCHAGCTTAAVCESIGILLADLFSKSSSVSTSTELPESLEETRKCRQSEPQQSGKVYSTADEAVAILTRIMQRPADYIWTYTDAKGEPVGKILRWNLADGKKDIRPVSRDKADWRIRGMLAPRPLYRLPELASADRVFVVEGEKAADAAQSLGLTATTSAHGAQSPEKTDWRPLAGKQVVILPDNDPPGRKYAETVGELLLSLDPPAIVKVVELPELPEGGDIFDWRAMQDTTKPLEELRKTIEDLAERSEVWTSPLSATSVVRFQPFPVDALPGPLHDLVVAGAKSIGCDSSFIALPLLSVLGAAIGNAARLKLKANWLVPPIIWTMIIGESGSAKTPAFQLVMKPVHCRQNASLRRFAEAEAAYQSQLALHKKNLGQWERQTQTSEAPPESPEEPKAERHYIVDTTIEAVVSLLAENPRGLLLARDELAGWLGSFDKYSSGKGGSEAGHWLSMFSAEPVIVDRKHGTPKTISVPHAAVSITGGIQPEIFKRSLGKEHRESGMAARFLLCFPPPRARRWTDDEIDPKFLDRYETILDELHRLPVIRDAEGQQVPEVVELNREAKEAFRSFFNRHGHEQSEFSGDLSAAWAKLGQISGRLALVIHFVRRAAQDPTLVSRDLIDVGTMAAAIELTEWFKGEARRVYDMLSETETERDQRRLVEWIQRKATPVTVREVQNGCRWLKAPGKAEQTLQLLVTADAGKWQPSPKGQPGQPTRRFILSPVDTTREILEDEEDV